MIPKAWPFFRFKYTANIQLVHSKMIKSALSFCYVYINLSDYEQIMNNLRAFLPQITRIKTESCISIRENLPADRQVCVICGEYFLLRKVL